MKKAYLLLAIGLGLAAVAVAGVDFSGTWAFNASKSDQPAAAASGGGSSSTGSTLTIKQAGNVLTINRTADEDTVVTIYTMDGADHTATPVQASASNLETPDYAKSMISLDGAAKARVTSGNNIEVEGSGTNHDKFQHDVILTATLSDAGGKSVGTATGRLEDLTAGKRGDYKLVGTTTSPTWAKVSVVISNITEHVATPQASLKYKAVLSGNSVHITGTQSSQSGDRPVDQTYTLSADGKTLTLASVRQGQNGPTTHKQVFDKK
jgi:hypothetical protein